MSGVYINGGLTCRTGAPPTSNKRSSCTKTMLFSYFVYCLILSSQNNYIKVVKYFKINVTL